MPPRFATIHAHVSQSPRVRRLTSDLLAREGYDVVYSDEGALQAHLDEVEVLLCGDIPRVDWARADRLRLLQLMSSGVDALWPATGLPAHVAIASARGMHLPEMKEHALALMLAFERRLFELMADQRAKRWKPMKSGSLAGKTVAILGLGAVGQALATSCTALGMRVIGTRGTPVPTPGVERVHGPGEIDRVLPEADYVVVLLPLTGHTRGILDAKALSMMRPGAVLLQLSRGGILDEAALVSAVREGRLRGASVDVFEHEPLPEASPLWTTPGIFVTPHVAGFVDRYFERALHLFVENLHLVEEGLAPRTAVSRSDGY
jgi:phosphoglycerate dehydrogenase-like enzyme